MTRNVLKIHAEDNVIVALEDLPQGASIQINGEEIILREAIPMKHKFAARSLAAGGVVIMYGVQVGTSTRAIAAGEKITSYNTKHATNDYINAPKNPTWSPPNTTAFTNRTFNGYHRTDGSVGVMNYWLVIPLVFCENRNVEVLKSALQRQLGYHNDRSLSIDTHSLIHLYQNGAKESDIIEANIIQKGPPTKDKRLFPNVDGIKFLTHQSGCGESRADSETLCKLLAGYINHPNVAGATVLSLGCQNAQVVHIQQALKTLNPHFDKPLFIFEQQKSKSEETFIAKAVKKTFVGLMRANKIERKAAPISKLVLGLECGGSDGFSGITANPALGYASDLLVALGGSTILAEFPELHGVEQELIHRCQDDAIAQKFDRLMKAYAQRAKNDGTSFEFNPSPGNIRDGLITDAMKSAGAAKKGGTSPIIDVLDYTEPLTKQGLNLLCTPGNDVESTTGLAGSGATLIAFTTGLGTPTGNPIAPTIKIATNTPLAERMADIIDINAGTIIEGKDTIASKGAKILECLLKVASGDVLPKAVHLGQDDFIPWKRGISL